MRTLPTILAVSAALLAAGCQQSPRATDQQPAYRSDVARPLPPSTSNSNPLPSAGASDSVSAGSTSNAASGSSATRQSQIGIPR